MPQFSRDEFLQMLDDSVSKAVESRFNGDGFNKAVADTIKDIFDSMQKDVNSPFNKDKEHLIKQVPGISIDSKGYMTTAKGSIINLNDKRSPWVSVSDEMKQWTNDFVKYVKNRQVSKFLNESVDTAGGYFVPEDFNALMIMYDAEDTLMWQRATVWPMVGEKMLFPKLNQNPDVESDSFDHFAGVSFTWTEEAGELEETEPSWAMIELIVHELSGYTEVSNTLLDDSAGVINLLNYLTILFRKAWYWTTDKAFLYTGTGGKKPLSIINDPQVLTVNRQTDSTVEVTDILNMDARMPAVFDNQAIWFITKKVRAALRGQKVSATSDELVLQESYRDFSEGHAMQLLGKPAYLADGKIPAIGTEGDVLLCACPWYYIGDRKAFSLDTSKDYKFRNNRTSLRMLGRVDGVAAIPQAFVKLGATS